MFGNITAPFAIRVAPFVTLSSGAPYDVLAGQDIFGDTYTNVRAAFAAAGAACGGDMKCTPFGNFSTALSATNFSNLVPRNYLTQPGLRLAERPRLSHFWLWARSAGANADAGADGRWWSGGAVPAVVRGGGGFGGGGPAAVAVAAAPVAAAVCAWVAAADAAAAVETPSTVST